MSVMRFPVVGCAVVFLMTIKFAIAAPGWDELKQQIRHEFPDLPYLTTEELAERIHRSGEVSPLLMDERTEQEHDVSHLAGARLAFNEVMAVELLKTLNREREVVVYCAIG